MNFAGKALAWGVAGTAAVGGAVGGTIGGFNGHTSTGEGVATGMAVGATAGAASIPVTAGVAVGAGMLGWAAVKNADKLGSGIIKAGQLGVKGLGAIGREIIDGGYGKHLMSMGETATKFMGKLAKYEAPTKVLDKAGNMVEKGGGIKLTKLGWGVMGVGGAAYAARESWNKMEMSHMGTVDSDMTTLTPKIPAYADNAGATGDLVFALNANRRG